MRAKECNDELGGLTPASGAVTDTYNYDAFGIQLSGTSNSQLLTSNSQLLTSNSYRYCGEYFDADLGLYYLRARHMNPETGRFHSMDTYEGRLGEPLSLHKYMYAHANPVMGSDPSGFCTVAVVQLELIMSLQQILMVALSSSAIIARWVTYPERAAWTFYYGLTDEALSPMERGFHAFVYAKKGGQSVTYDVGVKSLRAFAGNPYGFHRGVLTMTYNQPPEGSINPVAVLSDAGKRLWERIFAGGATSNTAPFLYWRPLFNCHTWSKTASFGAKLIEILRI